MNGTRVTGPLIDRFGRVHTSLRLSVTDRCNIRCVYCMPAEAVRFLPRAELLTFEELARVTRIAVAMGVEKVRITGGEPLVRSGLPELARQLRATPGLGELALTTNGLLLAPLARPLREAGVDRLNISLDALTDEAFRRVSRRDGLDAVLRGIDAALDAGFADVRLNAVALRGVTEGEAVGLARFAAGRGLTLRFIEAMPLDADATWRREALLPGAEVRELLEQEFGPLAPAPRDDPSQPARDYVTADGRARFGFINPVTEPFCGDCNRLRVTAEGKLRNCLFSAEEWDARPLLRSGATDAELGRLLADCVAAKRAGHGIDDPGFAPPARAMYQIGG